MSAPEAPANFNSMGSESESPFTLDFTKVLAAEQSAIRDRRERILRAEAEKRDVPKLQKFSERPATASAQPFHTVGVSLSGGGIRSAAFCLGALQSLGVEVGINAIDYLSTVSGGGYIGSCLSAAMTCPPKINPFGVNGHHCDTPAVHHIRDYSNYLFPRGRQGTFIGSLAVILRGLIVNAVFICAVVLSGATLTAIFAPWLQSHLLWFLAGYTAVFILLFAAVWALKRSLSTSPGSEIRGLGVYATSYALYALAVLIVVAIQPYCIAHLYGFWFTNADAPTKYFAGFLTAFGGAMSFFAGKFGDLIKTSASDPRVRASLKRAASWFALGLASLAVPFAVWLFYLLLSGQFIYGPHIDIFVLGHPLGATARWLAIAALVAVLWLFVACQKPNANSLHRLYRDRLSKAFLFDPNPRKNLERDLKPLDALSLAGLAGQSNAPYQLINCALNLQNSVHANRRGRDADFFLLSSEYCGSEATGYEKTSSVVESTPFFNLGTALAISGAAISSNMGAMLRPLAPTLALLNLRLGYWLPNPKHLMQNLKPLARGVHKILRRSSLYLLSEMLGLLDENHPIVYLTDGGHIENLGLYALLKRRCKIIFAVDAEADPNLTFNALAIAERYARIDLGVRINIPWQQIARTGIETRKEMLADAKPSLARSGPHCAVGTICYDNGETGYLIYVKSSLTGDENDAVLNYAARHPSFPHETTGDQFFSEEQFEAYRDLGFHAMECFFSNTKSFVFDGALPSQLGVAPTNEAVRTAILKDFG